MRIHRVTAVALALAVGLSVVGLTAGSAGAQSTPDFSKLKRVRVPSPCKNDPGTSSSQITVVGILPQTGPTAPSFADSAGGMKARLELANANGELGDRKIKFIVEDDAGQAGRNVTAAQKAVEEDNAFGILENSLVADASAKYLNQKGVPVVGWHLGLAAFGIYPNFFGWRNSFPPDAGKNTFTTLNGDYLKTKGVHRIALVGANTSNSALFIENNAGAIKYGGGKGMKVVYKTTSVTVDQRDFTAEAQKIKDAKADALVTGMDFLQDTALSAAVAQLGYKLKVTLFPAAEDTRILQLPGIEGAYFGTEVVPFELNPPSYQEYKAAMQKYAPGTFLDGEVPYIGWLSADTFIKGLTEAGVACPTRKAFITNLRLVKDWTANGAFNPVDFVKAFAQPLFCAYFVQVVNAKFVPQLGGKPFCATKEVRNGKVTKLTAAKIQNA